MCPGSWTGWWHWFRIQWQLPDMFPLGPVSRLSDSFSVIPNHEAIILRGRYSWFKRLIKGKSWNYLLYCWLAMSLTVTIWRGVGWCRTSAGAWLNSRTKATGSLCHLQHDKQTKPGLKLTLPLPSSSSLRVQHCGFVRTVPWEDTMMSRSRLPPWRLETLSSSAFVLYILREDMCDTHKLVGVVLTSGPGIDWMQWGWES